MEYMRDNLFDQYGILPLQNKILEIAVYIDKFCEQYGVDYCLMGGSALGAKRHKGFIPWDDDLDIFMTPANYEKFRKLFQINGDKKKFYLQEYGRSANGLVVMPKLRMNGTTYLEEIIKDWHVHHGIYVDIFILHTCPNSMLMQLWQCFWAKCVLTKGLAMRDYSRQTGIRKLLIEISKLLPRKVMVDFALKQVYRFRNKKTNYFCNFLGKALFKHGIYKREWFEKTEKADFEKVQLRVPVGLTEFLTERFGDYMKIPSIERIKWEQHAWKWDTEKDYTAYTNSPRNDFSDEKNLV